MIKHPDGERMTLELTYLASLPENARILDIGAGDGETVALLRSLGYDAIGIDKTASDTVIPGDMAALPFENNTFDSVIAECSMSVCGDTEKAFSEVYRVLKNGGKLCISDVYFKADNAPALSLSCPATKEGWVRNAKGFTLTEFHERTKVWTEFMIHCIWNGLDLGDCGYFKSAAKAKGGYFISVWEKEC